MSTYKVFNVKKFPNLKINEEIRTEKNLTLPGLTEPAITKIKLINDDYNGFFYYEINHEMLIYDHGIAYGFFNNEPVSLNFDEYKKKVPMKAFYNLEEEYILISARSDEIKDFYKCIKKNQTLDTEIVKIKLDLQKLSKHVDDFLSAWFNKVSNRVSSSALFGADLRNDPIFSQLLFDGELSSVTIPFIIDSLTYKIQLNNESSITFRQKIESIERQLDLIQSLKNSVLDHIIEDEEKKEVMI